MFCREHPIFVPKLCIVNLWKWALSTWVSLRCYNISFSGDGGGFPTQSRVSSTSVKCMGDGWVLWLVVGVPSLEQFVSPLVVIWVSRNKQSSREGTELDFVCCANVVIHCNYLGVLRVFMYILLFFFLQEVKHTSVLHWERLWIPLQTGKWYEAIQERLKNGWKTTVQVPTWKNANWRKTTWTRICSRNK